METKELKDLIEFQEFTYNCAMRNESYQEAEAYSLTIEALKELESANRIVIGANRKKIEASNHKGYATAVRDIVKFMRNYHADAETIEQQFGIELESEDDET